MDASLNIVDLIESNPITRLSSTYQNNLLTKIKTNFNDTEQQMFVASFYCYLNHNQSTDFVIDLDNIWKWLAFSSKQNAKVLLEKNFVLNKDYTKSLMLQNKQSIHIKGGHNKEIIMLNINTFKKFCLKAGTKKADDIHDYYIKLESVIQEVIQEESSELRLQLDKKNIEIQNQVIVSTKEKEKLREKTLLEQFPNNTQCVYYGIIDNLSDANEPLIKFGNSNSLNERVTKHRKTYSNFRLVNAFKVENKLQIENAMKNNTIIKERSRTITINQANYIELLNTSGITLQELDKIIKDIIIKTECKSDDYIRVLEENRVLTQKLTRIIETASENEIQNMDKIMVLTSENTRLKIDNLKLIKKYNTIKTKTKCKDSLLDTLQNTVVSPVVLSKDIENYGIIRNNDYQGKRLSKNKDGKYHIEGKVYDKLFGTRQEVWDGGAYKTTGELYKDELMIGNNGKLVSKTKSIQEMKNNRFVPVKI